MYDRKERLTSLIQQIISECVLFKIKDPRIGMVSINSVQLNSDKSIAKVFFSSLDGKPEDSLNGLTSARGYIRTVLSKEMKLRRIPEVRFYHDDSAEFVQKITDIVNKDHEED